MREPSVPETDMPHVVPRQTALLVIDVQESFRQRDYFTPDGLAAFFERCRRLVAGFEAAGLPVVRVLHVDPDGVFSKASGFVKPMSELPFAPAVTIEKHAHSALAGTALPAWLAAHGIARLAICGIRTEQCCETTTRHASDVGYEVDYVTEATMTWPMKTRSGRIVSADEIRERTELVLANRFATIVDVEGAIARAREHAAMQVAA
jgi:nicotinamidase-related amidase